MQALDTFRGGLGFALPVTGGYRCKTHNALVSSTGTEGPHTRGVAVDIGISGPLAAELVKQALAMGFRGVGIKQNGPWPGRFIHLDTDERSAQVIWTY